MGKTLVIAEKPSVARDIARVLGGMKQHKDYHEGDDYVVTSAVGHLLELAAPEGVEVKRGKWSLANLPVLPDHFDLQPIPKSESQLKLVARLYRRKDVDAVINACDAGREGELIFHYLIRHLKGKKPVRRLWLQSMTPAAIRAGFDSLRAEDDLLGLQRAAVCRSESDWLVGINATRAMTALNSTGGGFSLTTVGRVQTPTLAILVDREKEIQAFEPRDYWEVRAQFQIESGQYEGRWVAPDAERKQRKAAAADGDGDDAHGTARPERIWERARADGIVARISGKRGAASETTKPSSQSPPMLFDLTSLQREANRRFGFSARATLAIAQALYERHKALTYPRTDSRALPEDYPATVKKIMASLQKNATGFADDNDDKDDAHDSRVKPISHWAGIALEKKYIRADDKRVFNNARVSDHFAIVPTGEVPRKLKEQERRIYELVTRTFIATFFPPARFENTLRTTVVEGESFETRGKVLIESGWLQVMGRKDAAETLPPLASQNKDATESANVIEAEAESKQTKPAPRYSEATLLSAMEGAGKSIEDNELREAMKGRGLGTPATRAAIIEELIRNRYVLRDARELIPTPKASTLLRLLRALKIDELTAAELTGEWERKLKQIESDEFSADAFMQHIREMTVRIVSAARDCDVDQIPGEYATLESKCPKCEGEVRENYRKYVCQKCDFAIWKAIAGRELSPDEADELLRERRLGPLHGFRSRRGHEFSAELIVKDDFSVSFDFDDEDDDSDLDASACEKIGACPKCAAPVLDTPRRFRCANAIGDKPSCDFNLSKHILSRDITAAEAVQMLTAGRTALLEGFVSKKNNRKFAAHLTLDLANKTGKLGFEFPPRKSDAESGASDKKKVAKKTSKKKTSKQKTARKTGD